MNTALIEKLPIFEPLTQATRNALRPLYIVGSNDYLEIRSSVEREGYLLIRVNTWEHCGEDDAEGTTLTGVPVQRVSGYVRTRWQKWMSAFPECRLPPVSMEYEVPITDYSCLVIHCCWPIDRVVFQSEETRDEYLACLLQFFSTNKRAGMVAKFKQEEEVPEMPEHYEEPEGTELADYQKVAHMFGLGQSSSAWFMDRGTGKTICSISLVCDEAKLTRQGKLNPINGEGHMMRVLVVVPKHLRLNWQREFTKFSNTPGKVTIIRGGKVKRIKALTHSVKDDEECAFSVAIIPYDTVPQDIDVLKYIPWDRIITDESQYFKSPRSRRWKALRDLRDLAGRRLILTGSPIGNSYRDLYTQLEFGYQGNSGFGRYENFRSFHGKFKATGDGVSKLLGLENVPLLQEKLARYAFAVTKEEAGLNLPDKVYDYHEVDMTSKQSDFYNKMCSQLAIEIEEEEEDKRMTADHILTRLLRLAQLTSGFVTWEEIVDPHTGDVVSEKRVEQIDSIYENPKINAVVDMMWEKAPGEKTLIWSTSVEDIQAIHTRLQGEGFKGGTFYGATSADDRVENEDAFNQDPDFVYLVLNPMTGGVGLNLLGYDVDNPEGQTKHCYCAHEIFFCCNWSSLLRGQAEDRAHRRGTKFPVRITDLVVPNTIDIEIRSRVVEKQEMASLIQDVSEILKSVLNINMRSLVA